MSWWLLVTLAGAAALPLVTRLLGALPDKGYLLARPLGLLLTGYAFWLLGSAGLLRNTPGSMLLAWLLVLSVSLWVYLRDGERTDWGRWWRENRTGVIVGEILFFLALLAWAIYRAHQNDTASTEKPMDLMFLSSILRSETLPPNDAWLAGYSISYYWFGYLLSAMLTSLSGLSSGYGYSMTTALLFALTCLGAYAVVYNLVRARQLAQGEPHKAPARPAVLTGLLAMLMVGVMGNWQFALIELPFQARIAPESYLAITGTQDREAYPEREAARAAGMPDTTPVTLNPGQPDPTTWGGWWWFRASRVLNDYDLLGNLMPTWYAQPINEFPQFSFLLGDNHPHVMALPFVLLALGTALNLLLRGRGPRAGEMVAYALIVGALVFLNTWDYPIYLGLLLGAEALRRAMARGGRLISPDWAALVGLGLALAALTAAFYLPFLISFRSQAGGVLPNIITPTFLPQFVIMFGPFLVILTFYLAWEAWAAGRRLNLRLGIQVCGWILLALVVVAALLSIVVAAAAPQLLLTVNSVLEANGLLPTLWLVAVRRLQGLPVLLLLLAALALIVARLFPRPSWADDEQVGYPAANGFALLAAAAGCVLVLAPEFVFLRDNFSTRINTIFKFYYQAWVLFAVASAFGVYALVAQARSSAWLLFRPAAALAVLLGLGYPLFGVYTRAITETGVGRLPDVRLTLDGTTRMIHATDYAAIQCWQSLISERELIVVEALGGAYNPNVGRVAAITGVPSLLGWENHQRQWRGAVYDTLVTTRPGDVPTLYQSVRWEEARDILEHWDIDYVFFGVTEREQYGSAGEEKFVEFLEPVCAMNDMNGQPMSVFYRVTPHALEQSDES